MLTTYRLTVKRSSWQLVSPARSRVGAKLTICPTGDFNGLQRVTFTARRGRRFDSSVFVQSASSRASPWIAMLFTKVWKNPARAPALSPSRDQHLQTAARIVTHGAFINTASTESTLSKRTSANTNTANTAKEADIGRWSGMCSVTILRSQWKFIV